MIENRLFAFMLAVALATGQSSAQPKLAGLEWMAGDWFGSTGRGQLEERWTSPAGGVMLGVGRAYSGERLFSFEFLRIELRADGIYYVAQPGGRAPTDFKLTKSSKGEAVFENRQHDHPKIIVYRLEPDGGLLARVEGDEHGKHVVQEFRFRKGRAK